MEYRRRSRARSRAKRTGEGFGGRAVVALLLTAGVVYLVTATAAGEWLADNVMTPVIAAFSPESREESEYTAPVSALPEGYSAETELHSGAGAVTRELPLSAVSSYMLQTGVFSTVENAETAAADVRAYGGAGYVLFADGYYRVMTSACTSETAALTKRDSMRASGTDCVVYAVTTPGASFRVTATEEQSAVVTEALASIEAAQTGIGTAAEAESAADGRIAAQSAGARITAAKAAFDGIAGSGAGGAVSAIAECLAGYDAALSKLISASSKSDVDFCADMKYTGIEMTYRYAMLMEAISP